MNKGSDKPNQSVAKEPKGITVTIIEIYNSYSTLDPYIGHNKHLLFSILVTKPKARQMKSKKPIKGTIIA